jgi:hypothetical protein
MRADFVQGPCFLPRVNARDCFALIAAGYQACVRRVGVRALALCDSSHFHFDITRFWSLAVAFRDFKSVEDVLR